MNSTHRIHAALTVALLSLFGCAEDGRDGAVLSETAPLSFEVFRDTVARRDAEGVYIVDGDTPIADEAALRAYYDEMIAEWHDARSAHALIVHRTFRGDAVWSAEQARNLTYCVSDAFGSRKSAVLAAMDEAVTAWESVADIDFVHLTAEDGDCDAYNNSVTFDVRPVSCEGYLARAVFPDSARLQRNVLVYSSPFGPLGSFSLAGILRHELGHTLGFRHEHTRPDASSGGCYEDSNWRSLTSYDPYSVMHYPHCGGSNRGDLDVTALDAEGAAILYGAPLQPEPEPEPEPEPGTPRSGSARGYVAANDSVDYSSLTVLPGSEITVEMSGSGDPDLYVRFGARPSESNWDCRPYTAGANETCSLTVPDGEYRAYISVLGYTSANYVISVNWVSP